MYNIVKYYSYAHLKYLCFLNNFADIALIENNAKVAAEIALNLCERPQIFCVQEPVPVQSIISKQKPVKFLKKIKLFSKRNLRHIMLKKYLLMYLIKTYRIQG